MTAASLARVGIGLTVLLVKVPVLRLRRVQTPQSPEPAGTGSSYSPGTTSADRGQRGERPEASVAPPGAAALPARPPGGEDTGTARRSGRRHSGRRTGHIGTFRRQPHDVAISARSAVGVVARPTAVMMSHRDRAGPRGARAGRAGSFDAALHEAGCPAGTPTQRCSRYLSAMGQAGGQDCGGGGGTAQGQSDGAECSCRGAGPWPAG
jgi:hypothetical protein